jgi:hypothetical protein
VLPLTQKPGPARQRSFCLFAAYLREYRAKILKSSAFKTVEITEERIVEPRGDNLLQFASSKPQ